MRPHGRGDDLGHGRSRLRLEQGNLTGGVGRVLFPVPVGGEHALDVETVDRKVSRAADRATRV
jgi:hypothetical protein